MGIPAGPLVELLRCVLLSVMAPKEKKTKAQIAAAAAAGGKRGKKKWMKGGKGKEKTNCAVHFDAKDIAKVQSDIPKAKLITLTTVRDKCNLSGSLCKMAIRSLESEGKIVPVVRQKGLWVYTKTN